jgi:hypothetical protein
MSFRIYRLAKKEQEQGGAEGVFVQIITRPDGQVRVSGKRLSRKGYRERKNSSRAS